MILAHMKERKKTCSCNDEWKLSLAFIFEFLRVRVDHGNEPTLFGAFHFFFFFILSKTISFFIPGDNYQTSMQLILLTSCCKNQLTWLKMVSVLKMAH